MISVVSGGPLVHPDISLVAFICSGAHADISLVVPVFLQVRCVLCFFCDL